MARVPDPYLIPGTNVLRNLVGATDEDALAAAENDLCSARAAILRENLPPAEGTPETRPRTSRRMRVTPSRKVLRTQAPG